MQMEYFKVTEIADKTCPLQAGSACQANTCLWWVGNKDEGICAMRLLEPVADALTKIESWVAENGEDDV